MTRPVFVDTSAFYALLDPNDEAHQAAARTWKQLLDGMARGRTRLVTHSGILLEGSALVSRRLGMDGLRDLQEGLLPVAEMIWIGETLHRRAAAAMFAAGLRRVSLTDWISFEVMRSRRIRKAFTFNRDFAEQGFRTA